MRFGQDLHRRIIPEWSQHYVDYNLLKRLTKSFDLPDVYEHLDTSISALDSFFQLRFNWSKVAETELCESFGLGTEPTAIPDVTATCPAELALLHAAFSQIQQDVKKLQWFARVNTDAVARIFAKLDRYGQAEASSFRCSQAQWHELHPGWESQLLHRLDRLDGLMADTDRHLSLSQLNTGTTGKSLYLAHAFRQNTCRQVSTDAVQHALQTGGLTCVIQLMTSTKPKLSASDRGFLNLIHSLLDFSAMCAPEQFKALLDLLPSPEQFVMECRVFKWSIMATRARNRRNMSSNSGTPEAHTLINTLDSDKLLTKDRFDRLPLHYAASHQTPEVSCCQELVRALGDSAIQAILSTDKEALTPLHLAVMGDNLQTTIFLIDTIVSHNADGLESHARTIMGELLHVALNNQNDDIVHSLLQAGADISFRSSRGQTALHVAAELGRADYTAIILQSMSKQRTELDVPDDSRGWTPLFLACVDGYYDIVKLLLQAGLSQQKTDCLGWTAKEYAVFKGHLAVGELFEPSDVQKMEEGLTRPLTCKSTHIGLFCGKGEKVIIASLGITRKDRAVTGLNLSYCSSVYTPGIYENLSLALEVSAPGTTWKPRRVRLPILDDQINDPFIFPIPETIEPQLVFKIIRLAGRENEEILTASGTALLESNSRQFGAQRQSLIREQTVPILDKDSMSIAGTATFTFLVARPYPHLQTPHFIGLSRQTPLRPPLLVGHRGNGQNDTAYDHLQLGENTMESFLSAAKLGAAFVEYDIQVTRDLEAVAFHDFSLSQSGTDVPIHDTTLDQFLHASNIQSPHGNSLSALGRLHSPTEPGRPRSRSLGRHFDAGAIQVRDRMKHTVDFGQKGFKSNTRGDFIHDSFATLKEILVELPENIGFDVEIKYPRVHEAVDAGVAPVGIELNTFVDVTLEALHRHGGQRQIMLSSFTPEICILLSMKQRSYPVFFITNAGKVPMVDMEVRAASVQVAVQFARRWNLAGMVFACEALLLCPRLVGFVKTRGLVCATYGVLNNDPQMVKLQVEAGVDIIIADRVGLVAKTLADMSVSK